MNIDLSHDYACKLDKKDELASYRQKFFSSDADLVYMDGNSLGRLPLHAAEHIEQVIKDEWGTKLIRSWGINWFQAPISIGEKIARLIGAEKGQVAVSDSTTVNLYKLAMSALMLKPERKKIITDKNRIGCNRCRHRACHPVARGVQKRLYV